MTAESAHRPSRTRTIRRRGSRTRRRLIRSLLGAALAVAGVLVPLEAADLPDSPVMAQDQPGDGLGTSDGNPPGDGTPDPGTPAVEEPGAGDGTPARGGDGPVTDGMPEDCPPLYQPSGVNGPLCLLEVSACGASPASLGDARLEPSVSFPETLDADMRRIGRYPDFCEARFSESDAPAAYEACTERENTKGFVVKTHVMERLVDEEGNPVLNERGNQAVRGLCRIIRPTSCTAGAQVAPYGCRAVRRRTWSCPAGYVPRNDFNSCFKPLSRPDGPHPACGPGAPELHILNCADYAANDYVASPGEAAWACGGDRFGTGSDDIRLQSNPANRYWCQFDSSHLRVACHRDSPPAGECTPKPALCLKRVSRMGGCNAIANTIRCRILQAGFADGHSTLGDVRTAGCQPCVLLPFEPRPATCPDDINGEPAVPQGANVVRYNAVHAVKADFSESVRVGNQNVCAPMLRGEYVQACVDASKVCQDPPAGNLTWSSTHVSQLAVVNLPVILTVGDMPSETAEIVAFSALSSIARSAGPFLKYPVEEPGGSSGTGARDSDPAQAQARSVIRRFPALDPDASLTGLETFVRDEGRVCRYRDRPAFKVIVEELLPERDEQVIEELFGDSSLDWWDGMSVEERENLKAARGGTRTIEPVDCNHGEVIWCRWTPTRSGYYKLTAAGAWIARRLYKQVRGPLRSYAPGALLDYYREWDLILRALREPAERDRIRRLLRDAGLQPADLGLNQDLTGFLPLTSMVVDADTGYTLAGLSCRDVRFICGTGGGGSVNYTESEPIGIVVHEVRVATRSPNT